MSQLDRLIRDARAAMKARGHIPQPAERWCTSSEGRSGATIDCAKCGKSAIVIARPLPNEVNIGGEVLAINCASLGATLIADAAEAVDVIGEDVLERYAMHAVMGC